MKNKLIATMENHKGRNNAVSVPALAQALNIPQTELRELYSEIVCKNEAFLGSSPDVGLFQIADNADFELAIGHLASRANKLYARVSALKKMHEEREIMPIEEVKNRMAEVRGAMR